MNNRRWITSVVYLALGVGLLGCGIAQILDEFWSGMGGGLMGVGLAQMVRHIRYRTNSEYREKVDIDNKDERNRFISGKAWAWAGYGFVMIMAVMIFVFKFTGHEELMQMASFSICLVLLLYWGSWIVLKRKY